jgi:hypothetical protein
MIDLPNEPDPVGLGWMTLKLLEAIQEVDRLLQHRAELLIRLVGADKQTTLDVPPTVTIVERHFSALGFDVAAGTGQSQAESSVSKLQAAWAAANA